MKKIILSAMFVFVTLFFISCASPAGGLSEKAQKNLEAMHGITNCFETKDFSKLGDFIAQDAVDHAGENGDIIGVENMKAEYARMMEGLENGKSKVIKELADDEYVMSWMQFTGTLKKDMMGMKAGESYNSSAIELAKFKDGKAIEHWTFMQPVDMMKMMGGAPSPDAAKPDSASVSQ